MKWLRYASCCFLKLPKKNYAANIICWKLFSLHICTICTLSHLHIIPMLHIRNATTADIPLIRELCLQVWPQTYTPIVGERQVAYMLGLFYSPDQLAKANGRARPQIHNLLQRY